MQIGHLMPLGSIVAKVKWGAVCWWPGTAQINTAVPIILPPSAPPSSSLVLFCMTRGRVSSCVIVRDPSARPHTHTHRAAAAIKPVWHTWQRGALGCVSGTSHLWNNHPHTHARTHDVCMSAALNRFHSLTFPQLPPFFFVFGLEDPPSSSSSPSCDGQTRHTRLGRGWTDGWMDVWVGGCRGRTEWMDGRLGSRPFHLLLLPEVGHQGDG